MIVVILAYHTITSSKPINRLHGCVMAVVSISKRLRKTIAVSFQPPQLLEKLFGEKSNIAFLVAARKATGSQLDLWICSDHLHSVVLCHRTFGCAFPAPAYACQPGGEAWQQQERAAHQHGAWHSHS